MCTGCWREYGFPTHTSPDIEHAAALVRRIYETEPSGQPLHIELDDWNIEDEWWQVYEEAEPNDPAVWPIARELAALMKRLPLADRAAALAIAKEYFDPERVDAKESA